ncbi:MAG: glycosyltransferase family 2 protein [Rickettsia endosymbiont of Ixodes persulcatus]|nr:glycosyltransferase family 2 protein [Rickettsia endosymbiont of Ixodes persulcatus]
MNLLVQVSAVVPVYNEENNIIPFLERIEFVLGNMKLSYEIIFCLDPSLDTSEKVIRKQIERNPNIKLLLFSRKFGQPAATMAGILYCKGETCVVIDVDLQDPPETIRSLYNKLQEGYDVVYATRCSRRGETKIKKLISYIGYKLINKLSEVEIPANTGDFRIMTRRIIEELRCLNESHGFLRGLIAYVGFRQTFITYERDSRFAGKGKYNRFTGSIKIGLNGLISFSSRPLQWMAFIGAFMAVLSFLLGAWYVFQKLFHVALTPGLSTTILVITFFSGIQLLSLGLMGEYISRIYDQVKNRPLYIIDKIIENNKVINCERLLEKTNS